MLGPDDLARIDHAARELLENPGIKMEDDEIVRLLFAAGAREGSEAGVVRLPSALVTERLALAPRRIALADRAGGIRHVGPGLATEFWTGAALFYMEGGEGPGRGVRLIRKAELADFARVIETCADAGAIVGTSVDDVPPVHRDFEGLAVMADNTRKHLRALAFTPRGSEAVVRMGEVLAGGTPLAQRPVVSVGFTSHGPLRWTSLALGVFRATAGHGVPCTVNGEPMAGASAPVTLAGTLAVGCAEVLAGIVVNQLLEPGRPCFFNLGFSHVMDMRQGFAVTGGPENGVLAAAGAQLAAYYHLPSASWMCTDSLEVDEQNALEKTLAAAVHFGAGVSVIWGVGQVESEKTLSPVQALIDDEIAGMTRAALRPPRVDDTTLGVDVTRRVGVAGSYLADDHTLAHYRDEAYVPRLAVRKQRGAAGGSATLMARARERLADIRAAPRRPCLGDTERREIEKIAATYRSLLDNPRHGA